MLGETSSWDARKASNQNSGRSEAKKVVRRVENNRRRCRGRSAAEHERLGAPKHTRGKQKARANKRSPQIARTEKRSSLREARRRTLEREKTSLTDEGTKTPNYNSTKDCFVYFGFHSRSDRRKRETWFILYRPLRAAASLNCSNRSVSFCAFAP